MTITAEAPTMTTNAPTAPTLEAITLPYSPELLGGFYAVALHAAKDDVTLVINHVQVGARYLLATDRYSAGQWAHTVPAHDVDVSDLSILIPRATAEWLAKQSPKLLGLAPYPLPDAAVIVFARTSVTIQDGLTGDVLAVQRFEECTGNFPPVGRLFPDVDANPEDAPVRVSLNPKMVERFTKGAIRTLDREAAFKMTQTKTANPQKPGPVLFEFAAFRGLLQPNLMLR